MAAPEGGTTGQRARSKRVVNEEIVQDRAPDLNSYGRWARGIDIRAAADAGVAMATNVDGVTLSRRAVAQPPMLSHNWQLGMSSRYN